ncbi:MAG: transglutaminase, partial [Leeuwenhoekiella sp.]
MFAKKLMFICLLSIFCLPCVFSQNYKYGKVSEEELSENIYPADSTAAAVILHRGRDTYFDYDDTDGWIIVTEIEERVKILNKEGLDYATKTISLYRDGSDEEIVHKIDGVTYNLSEGKITEEDLKKDGIFKTEVNEHWSEVSLALPDVKVGSVIEYKYVLVSPFYKIDDIVFQEKIPVDHVLAKIRTPQFFIFNRIKKGYYDIEPKEYLKERSMSIRWAQKGAYGTTTHRTNTGVLNLTEFITEFEMQKVPALYEESYVKNIDDYQYKIVYELQSVKFPNDKEKKYATTWDDVAKTILKSDHFGKQLEKTGFINTEEERIKKTTLKSNERMQMAFDFIKSRMTWNGKTRKYTEDDLIDAYKKGSGNSAEVNLMLIAMLKGVGLTVNPILVSTRDHGVPLFPTLEGYNYVIAGVKINDKLILLDATEKLAVPDLLPSRVYNWVGRMVHENGKSEEIELYSKIPVQRNTLVNAQLDNNGAITGEVKQRFLSIDALDYRKTNGDKSFDAIANTIADDHNLTEVYELSVDNMDNLNKPILESFQFEMINGVDRIGNSIYFN